MNFKQRVIMLSSIGFGLGVLIQVVIIAISLSVDATGNMVYLSAQNYSGITGNPGTDLVINMLVSGLYGMLAMGGSSVYGIEEWGILKCTATHYLVTMASFFIIAFSFRWFTFDNLGGALIMFVAMTAVYVVIWLSNYISYKVELGKINKKLTKMKLANK